ncbi:glycosyltransferase family 10 domain-containing protein [Paraglaciecola marina]|uniref:glycosyltransferase family 10 domain-containing protein n=1 Tax=Paraglaciecola marina TaxID=2500157 RepID=UPI00105E74FD|nr:glycosyltransferase family 10 [Paraglaciecola marina]
MKIRCILLGRHSNRTPMVYSAYKKVFSNKIEFVSNIDKAHVVILGFVVDLNGLKETLITAQRKNPSLKIVVISEELLWDTIGGGRFWEKYSNIEISNHVFHFWNLNHVTTDIYNFHNIPYYLTTDNHYFSRYSAMFAMNVKQTANIYKSIWQKAKYQSVFLMQKRFEDKYDVTNPAYNIKGLCRYRSAVAQNWPDNSKVISGFGWGVDSKRQDLPDWHLDKITTFNRQTQCFSAVENTHQKYYITEKIFDAFALSAIPLYFANSEHRIYEIVKPNSFINLFGVESLGSCLSAFNNAMNCIDLDSYVSAQIRLSVLFSKPILLAMERARVVAEIYSELIQIMDSA